MQAVFKFIGVLIVSMHINVIGNCQTSIIEPVKVSGFGNRIIEPATLASWYQVGPVNDVGLSPDGKYATWSVDNWREKKYTFVVAATGNEWKHEFHNEKVGDGFFVSNSKQYVFPVNKGLCIVPLGEGKPKYMRPVINWQRDGKGRLLVWQENDSAGLTLKNLVTGRIVKLEALQDFTFDKTGQWLIGKSKTKENTLYLYNLSNYKLFKYNRVEHYRLQDDSRGMLILQNNPSGSSLLLVKLPTGKHTVIHTIGKNAGIVNFCMDNTGTAVTFTTSEKKDGENEYVHWYYKEGDAKPVKLVANHTSGIASRLKLSSWARFTGDSKYLFFNLVMEPDKRKLQSNAVMVDVWSYNDEEFYAAQPTTNEPRYYPAVISVDGGQVVQLISKKYEELEGEITGNYALVSKRQVGDRFWEYKRDSIWLIHLMDGTKKLLPFIKTPWIELEQGGLSVVGFDTYRARHYYRYDINAGTEKKLSENVPDWTLGIENPFMTGRTETEKLVNHVIAARTKGKNEMLTYDNYDIWMIDLTGEKLAVNITNGQGRKKKLTFRLVTSNSEVVNYNNISLLTAFNERTKDNGFYRKRLAEKGNPDSLIMGSYFFTHDRKILGNLMTDPYGTGMLPIKALEADAWIVRRESATEAPNYFFTRNFKLFKPLTNLQPQKEYNWYTTELVNYVQIDGVANQGVLYKPVDFNPGRKYPVLFYYYEQYSYGLNCFIPPAASEAGKPNIPWYVSRGYLVFTPDNYFQKGWRAKSCMQAVVGAAWHLKSLPFIDSMRMGIMGLSQGGGFTNYIVTHSNLFAAAFEGCGVSNHVSAGLQWAGVNGEGGSRLPGTEKWVGTNMWDNPEQWVGESPVLRAHTVTTPLLIMHNKKDGAVLFGQAIEMFTALRRLNKKVWLLQYDRGGHGVNGRDAIDLTTRVTQFFDHYLKGAPPPKWMVESMPASLKGVDDRLQLVNDDEVR